jgi:hypothetical protein
MVEQVKNNKIIAIPNSSHIDFGWDKHFSSLRGKKNREWFSTHAYHCLPLLIGNQYGFVVKSCRTFEVVWNGGRGPADSNVTFSDQNHDTGQFISSHFGDGIITVQNSFILRTPPGVNLMTINPPNYFIDGIGHMTGVIETDNLRRDFTFNLKITRPHYPIKINEGSWIGCFIPIPRYFVDEYDLINAKEHMLQEDIEDEWKIIEEFGRERQTIDSKKPHAAGKRYFKGEDVYGNKFSDHQKGTKPHPGSKTVIKFGEY